MAEVEALFRDLLRGRTTFVRDGKPTMAHDIGLFELDPTTGALRRVDEGPSKN